MLKNKLNITALFTAVLLIISLTNITAFADELPDLSVKGTITISMKKDGKAVPGGEFEIYYIANIAESKGSLKYVFTENFKNCGLSLDNIESDRFASDLESYIKSNKFNGVKNSVDNNGIARFNQLEAGIYFVIQNEAAKGYSKANSFTVSLPVCEDGKYNYTVNASPKFSFSDSKFNTETTATTAKPSKPTDINLPKTGQLNLPIPILTVSGICLLVLGVLIRSSGRKGKNEE
ncbi:MAG: hypothetical protein ACLUFN_01305 [Eubacterium sp.]